MLRASVSEREASKVYVSSGLKVLFRSPRATPRVCTLKPGSDRPLDTILLYFLRPIFSLGARLYLHICLPWRLAELIVLCVVIFSIFTKTTQRCGLVRRAAAALGVQA